MELQVFQFITWKKKKNGGNIFMLFFNYNNLLVAFTVHSEICKIHHLENISIIKICFLLLNKTYVREYLHKAPGECE